MNNERKVLIKICSNCGKERKIQNRSYKKNIKQNNGKYICYDCYATRNKNEFRLSDDGTYWIGRTYKGEEFLFNGDDKTVEQIKSCIWHINDRGFVINGDGKRLHRMVMKMEDKRLQVVHKSGDKLDNRIENLEIPADEIDMQNCSKCEKKCDLVRRSYNDNIERNGGVYICQSCAHRKENEFKLSDDGTYWIGRTYKGEEFLFNGDDETIEYIKSCTWHVGNDGYIINSKNERLHKIVMKIDEGTDIIVNHIGGNTFDNRSEVLEQSTHKDNSKERKPSKKSKTNIVGLGKRGDKYFGRVAINKIGKQIITPLKDKDNALIDLLIIQKEYGYKHNQELYGLLEDISDERKQEVLDFVKNKIEDIDIEVKPTNTFVLSKDKKYYEVYDKKNRMFKISKEDKDKVEKGSWRIHKKSSKKEYVVGEIVEDGRVKTVQLHRYLKGIHGDEKYHDWYIDHKNGDSLDNRRENLVITDAKGNALNRPTKGYKRMNGGRYIVDINLLGKNFTKSVATEEEAKNLVKEKKEEAMKNRLEFNNKKELDDYISSNSKDELSANI